MTISTKSKLEATSNKYIKYLEQQIGIHMDGHLLDDCLEYLIEKNEGFHPVIDEILDDICSLKLLYGSEPASTASSVAPGSIYDLSYM